MARKGDRNVYKVAPNDEKENVTVLVNCNAAGDMAPPMVVYRYSRLPHNIAKSVPDSWAIGKSPTGWMRHNTFYEYFANTFIPWLVEKEIRRPVLMFLDSHASHDTYHLSQLCMENGVELLPLLPHATHLMQPCDLTVFHSTKTLWREEVRIWREKNEFGKVALENFSPILKDVLPKIERETMINGFKASGLCPYNPDAVKFLNFNPSADAEITSVRRNDDPMDKACLRHLEKFIGNRKVLDFINALRNNQSVKREDESLYSYWVSLKKEAYKVLRLRDGPEDIENVNLEELQGEHGGADDVSGDVELEASNLGGAVPEDGCPSSSMNDTSGLSIPANSATVNSSTPGNLSFPANSSVPVNSSTPVNSTTPVN
jgi:hypothetical protein